MVTGEWDVDLRGRMVSIVSTPSRQPDRVLIAFGAALLRHGATLGDSAPQVEAGRKWPDLQRLLGKALPRIGGKLSEDDDGYYNIALSPELKERTGNTQQSYRGIFQQIPDPKVGLYQAGQQPVSGILDVLIESGGAELVVRRSGRAQPEAALESFYIVRSASDSPEVLQHVVSPKLILTEEWMPEWDCEAAAASAEPEEWMLEAVDASLAAIGNSRTSRFGDAEIRLLHCGLLQGTT